MHAKFHLDASNRLATIHQCYRQTDRTDRQDRQRTDSIGRTVLQTVAQNLTASGALPSPLRFRGCFAPNLLQGLRSLAPLGTTLNHGRLDGSRRNLACRIGRGPDDTVLNGDPGHPPKMGTVPHFWSMSIVSKRLDGSSRRHLVKASTQATVSCMETQLLLPKKEAEPPSFRPCSLWPNGWMD